MIRRLVAIFVAVLLMGSAVAFGEEPSANDTARILAGLPVAEGSALQNAMGARAWKSHSRYFNNAWKKLEERQIKRIRKWSQENIPKRQSVVFYMFSGPDALYADTFFGGAENYILVGLEPVGRVGDLSQLSAGALGSELRSLQHSLNSVLSYSFFITKKMKTDLRRGRVRGTLPVIMTFLARSNKIVKSYEFMSVNKDGSIGPGGKEAEKGAAKGVRIEFTAGDGKPVQTLYYFSTDISDGGLKRTGFLKFCKEFGTGDSLVKSASYLMHKGHFSKIRQFLLENSATLLQDDSGIPLRYFKKGEWDFKPFGRYLRPLSIFPGTYQGDMARLFGRGRATPIKFSYGYHWRPNQSNVLLATRKGGGQTDAGSDSQSAD